jgi:hypothetical protein
MPEGMYSFLGYGWLPEKKQEKEKPWQGKHPVFKNQRR